MDKLTAEQIRLNAISEKIIGCVFKVSSGLGVGFLEKVYQNALAYELRKLGMNVLVEHPINVLYDRVVVGEYVADLLVENSIILELKVVGQFDDIHFVQCLNYLKGTGLKLGLLINFGLPKAVIKRIVNNF